MTRQQFRFLLVVNQILLFASYPVGAIGDSLLPPELAGQVGADASVMDVHAGDESIFDDPLYVLATALNFATLIAAVGLFFMRRWGRTLYVACFVASLVIAALTPFYLNAGLTVAVGTLYGLTEVMVIGLVYFSHLRRMFARLDDEGEGEDEE